MTKTNIPFDDEDTTFFQPSGASLPPLAKNFPKPSTDGKMTKFQTLSNTTDKKYDSFRQSVSPSLSKEDEKEKDKAVASSSDGNNSDSSSAEPSNSNDKSATPSNHNNAKGLKSFFQNMKQAQEISQKRMQIQTHNMIKEQQQKLQLQQEDQREEEQTNGGLSANNSRDKDDDSNDDDNEPVIQTDLPPVIASSCDKDEPILAITPSSAKKAPNRFETFWSTARRVDKMRLGDFALPPSTTEQQQQQQNMQLVPASSTSHPSESSASSSSSSQQGQQHLQPEQKTVDDILKENKRLSTEGANKKLVDDLKRRIREIQKDNYNLLHNQNKLEEELKEETAEKEALVKEAKKELEERNMKLAVLEEHFIALNEHNGASFDSVAGMSYDTEDSSVVMSMRKRVFSEEDASLSIGSGKEVDEDLESAKTDSGSAVGDGDSLVVDTVSPLASQRMLGSIVKLDKATFSDLKLSLKSTKKELEKMKEKYQKHRKAASEKESDLKGQVEDLAEKITCRESTIANLEKSLKKIKESRFQQKSIRNQHRRRSTMSEVPSVTAADEGSDGDDSSVNTHNVSLAPIVSEEMIAEAVKHAIEEKEKEHSTEIDEVKDHLNLKDKIIKKLEAKVKTLQERGGQHHRSPSRQQMSEFTTMRNMSVANGMMDTTVQRLESMIKQLDQSVEDGTANQSVLDIPDELEPVRRVTLKVSMLNDEMKLSMKLIEQSMTNKFDSIKIDNFQEKKDVSDMVVTGQSSAEGGTMEISSPSAHSQSVSDIIDEAKTDMKKMFQEVEASMNKNIAVVTDRLQDIEDGFHAKQDMIEALELACSEHVSNYRALQEQMDAMRTKMEGYAEQLDEQLEEEPQAV